MIRKPPDRYGDTARPPDGTRLPYLDGRPTATQAQQG